MKMQFLSLVIALPIVLLSAVKSLAFTLTTAQIQADTPHLRASTPSPPPSKASCAPSRSCSKKPDHQKVVSESTSKPKDPPCPLPRRC